MKNAIFLIGISLLSICTGQEGGQISSFEQSTEKIVIDKVTHLGSKAVNDNLKSYKGFPIVFYNVENLFDTKDDLSTEDDEFTPQGRQQWTESRYTKKLENLVEVITASDDKNPVLMGLAEVENSKVLRDLISTDKLNASDYKIAHYDSHDRRGIDVALLYDEARFLLLHKEKITIKSASNNSRNNIITTRDILYVHGELQGNKEIHVFVNHWPSRRAGKEKTEPKRLHVASVLRAKINEILFEDKKANILVMGDFNDHPDDKSIYEVLRAKQASKLSDGDLVNLLIEEHEAGEGTHVYKREWAVLDQMMVSQSLYANTNGLGVQEKNAFILREDFLIHRYQNGGEKPDSTYGGRKYYGGYSDHLLVFLRLE